MKQATNLSGVGNRRSLFTVIAALAALAMALSFIVGARPAAAQDEEYIGPRGIEALEQAEENGVTAEELTIGEALAFKNPDSANFGNVELNTSQTSTFTVGVQRVGQVCIPIPFLPDVCVGNVPVKINGANVGGQGFSKASSTCENRELAAGQTCAVNVQFAPTSEGPHSGQLTFIPGKITLVNLPIIGSVDIATRFTDGATAPLSGNGLFVDRTKPSVTAFSPTGKKVSPKANVAASFSEAMNQGTLNSSNVKLVKKGTSRAVGATLSFPAPNKVVLNPTRNLKSEVTYTATITTGAQDLAGNGLAAQKSWSFKTK